MGGCYRKYTNSMGEEGGSRSLTSTHYAQTKFTSFGAASPAHNYVPFLHKSLRFGSTNAPSAPPIGTYDLPSCFARKKSPFEDRISHFLLDSHRPAQTTGAFRSTLTRFQQPASGSPGPASYNLFASPTPQRRPLRADKENAGEASRTCPSIPHKANRYGYSLVNGEMRKIEKTALQLEKERESRKNYVETLEGENLPFRESLHRDFHGVDERRRLYDQTSKLLEQSQQEAGHCRSENNLLRKPKYDHLYHSKAAPLSNQHLLIGPGQYDISGKLTAPARKEKFQFFGSTEVRFKERSSPEKGYSLLEMIKENHTVAVDGEKKKSPFKKKLANNHSQETLPAHLPGPGEYDPQVHCSKQTRRTAFFPAEQRFKQPTREAEDEAEAVGEFGRSRSKKSYNANTLKKERFKPIHQDYQPVRSEQIYGIVSEANESLKHSPKRAIGKLLKLNTKRGTEGDQEINSWSREEGRKKGTYIRQLKEELAFISYSPLPEEASKKPTKKLERRDD